PAGSDCHLRASYVQNAGAGGHEVLRPVATEAATRADEKTVAVGRDPDRDHVRLAGPAALRRQLYFALTSGGGDDFGRKAHATCSSTGSVGCCRRQASKPPFSATASNPIFFSWRAARALVASLGQVQ